MYGLNNENAVPIKHSDMCDDNIGLKINRTVSTILLIVSVPCVFINYMRIIPTVLAKGYLGYYTSVSEYSQMGPIYSFDSKLVSYCIINEICNTCFKQ